MPRGPHGAGGATDDHAARPMTSVGWTRPILGLKTRTDVSCQLLTEAEALSPHAFESFQNVVCPAENVRPATTGNRDSFSNHDHLWHSTRLARRQVRPRHRHRSDDRNGQRGVRTAIPILTVLVCLSTRHPLDDDWHRPAHRIAYRRVRLRELQQIVQFGVAGVLRRDLHPDPDALIPGRHVVERQQALQVDVGDEPRGQRFDLDAALRCVQHGGSGHGPGERVQQELDRIRAIVVAKSTGGSPFVNSNAPWREASSAPAP
jgi:hypothetical protein